MRLTPLYLTAGALVIGLALLACQVATFENSSETAAVVGLVWLSLGLTVVAISGKRPHPISMFAVFTYSHAVLFVARPLYNGAFQGSIDPFGAGPHDGSIVVAAMIAGAGYGVACVAYAAIAKRGDRASSRTVLPMEAATWRSMWPMIAIVIATGTLLYSVYVRQIGGLGRLLEVSSGRSVELTQALAGASGYFTSGLLFTLGASTVLYCQGLTQKRQGLAAGGVVLLILGSGPQLLSGSRSVFLPLAVTLLVCFVWAFPGRVRRRHIFISLIPAFLLFFILPRLLRQGPTDGGGGLVAQLSPAAVADGFLGGLDTAMIDAFAHQVAAQMSGQLAPSSGMTYLGALGAVVPRAWWPGKPETVDNLLNQALFPETAAKSIGFSFGVYSEPYLNFGVVGVLCFGAIIGAVCALVDRRMHRNLTAIQLAVAALAIGALFPIVRGSLTFDLQRFLIPAIPVILIYLLVRHKSSGLNYDLRASMSRGGKDSRTSRKSPAKIS